MAFPAVRSATTAAFSAAATSHSIPMPATVNAGDRLLCLVTMQLAGGQSSSFTFPGGWTELLDVNKTSYLGFALAWKIADGTEDGTNITVTSSVSRKVHHKTWAFADAGTLYAANEAITYASNGNPPSLNPGVGAKDFRWLALCVVQGSGGLSGYPSGYTDTGSYLPITDWLTDVRFAWAFKNANASSEDPGAFTSETTERAGITIAIAPTEAPPASISSVTPVSAYPTQEITVNLSNFSAAPTAGNCTLGGIAITPKAGATSSVVKFDMPPRSAFRYGGAYAAARFGVGLTLVVGNGTDSASTTVTPIAEQPGGFGTKDSGTSPYDLGTYNSGAIVLATGDDVWLHLVSGAAGLNPAVPQRTPHSAAVVIDAQYFDVSAGSWSGLSNALNYSEAVTITPDDLTPVPGQVVRLTISGTFGHAITGAVLAGVAVSYSIVDATHVDVTLPAMDLFRRNQSHEATRLYADTLLCLVAGSEVADATIQIQRPAAGVFATAEAPPWGYAPDGAQEGDDVYMERQSGAGTATPETFDFEETEPSIVHIYTFNIASSRWLDREEVYIGYAGRANDKYTRAVRVRSFLRLNRNYRPSRLRPFKF